MKILIGFILFLSVSFACDQPYEEFEGYKIGCNFEDKNNEFQLVELRGKLSLYQKNADEIFDSVNVIVLNGNIEGLVFVKNTESLGSSVDTFSEDRSLAKKAALLIRKINERFGENIQINPNRGTMIWTPDPNNKIISMINVTAPTIKNDNFDVVVYSIKLSNYFNQIKALNSND
ncbi:hypothetical protein [Wohlfahrtiimonas populi]|uniref:hypothetical protein n=1 Tax=Wohlfahrtiimonas populi TaxID=1940240 RepID=UPI00098D07F0|nr:hypothetical protein [Wohlfahrtiimonas populi]